MNMMNDMNYNQAQIQGSMSSQQNYYFNQSASVRNPPAGMSAHINVDNILFVADLPDDTCEEDLANFFKARNFCLAKIFK